MVSQSTAPAALKSSRVGVVAALLGSTLEWFDFAVYGYFGLIISPQFFPLHTETNSLLATTATFGVGFIMRPLGALVLGRLGDTQGRKATLSYTILLMALGTAMMGFAPTYATAGLWGPVILVLARLIQGFSAGGEMGGSIAFLVEQAPANRRGYFASWQQASQVAALLLGALFAAAMTGLLSHHDLEAWGWRVPFLFGLIIGPAGWYMRSKMSETQEFEEARTQSRADPLAKVLTDYRTAAVVGGSVILVWTVCAYLFLVYMPTYAIGTLRISQSTSFLTNSVGLVVVMCTAPLFGALSDKVGRARLMIGFAVGVLIAKYPAMAFLAANPNGFVLLSVQILFAILFSGVAAPAPAALAELYPAALRSTGISVSYNFTVSIFGGFTPFLATWLIAYTHNPLSPAWYVTAAAAVSLACMAFALRAKYLSW